MPVIFIRNLELTGEMQLEMTNTALYYKTYIKTGTTELQTITKQKKVNDF